MCETGKHCSRIVSRRIDVMNVGFVQVLIDMEDGGIVWSVLHEREYSGNTTK